jgi:hypothetical protein
MILASNSWAQSKYLRILQVYECVELLLQIDSEFVISLGFADQIFFQPFV